ERRAVPAPGNCRKNSVFVRRRGAGSGTGRENRATGRLHRGPGPTRLWLGSRAWECLCWRVNGGAWQWRRGALLQAVVDRFAAVVEGRYPRVAGLGMRGAHALHLHRVPVVKVVVHGVGLVDAAI